MNENKDVKKDLSVSYARMTAKSRKLLNTILILVFVLIFAGVNVLAMFLVDRFPGLQSDWTASGSFSLNDTTKEYLSYLEKEVNVKVLMDEDKILEVDSAYGYQVNQLLKEISRYDKVNVENLDLISTSQKAMSEKYPDIDWTKSDNFLIVEDAETMNYKGVGLYDVFAQTYDANYNVIIGGQYLEQTLLTNIQTVTANKIFKVALSTGNGEFFNENSEFYSYCSYLPYFLKDNAYEVENIDLFTQTPSQDTDVIFMMAPNTDLTKDAVDALSVWLTNDGEYGKTFVYVPFDHAGDLPNLDLFLEQWGLAVQEGYISENDLSRSLALGDSPGNLFPLMDYHSADYTENLKNKSLSVIMPYCMPIEILDDTMATPLLVSSATADILVPSSSDETGADYIESKGEALVGAAVSVKTNESDASSNVVVWGAFDALKNDWTYSSYSSNVNNITYFINLLNTLTDNDSIVVVESAQVGAESILVTSGQKISVGIIFIFVLPIAVVILGVVIWNKRRHR